MITSTGTRATPPGTDNTGIVPPWLQYPIIPLPDPIGDSPYIKPFTSSKKEEL